jgi:hypothetical protein
MTGHGATHEVRTVYDPRGTARGLPLPEAWPLRLDRHPCRLLQVLRAGETARLVPRPCGPPPRRLSQGGVEAMTAPHNPQSQRPSIDGPTQEDMK